MSDTELLQAIYHDMQSMKCDIQGMKDDFQGMKDDIQAMKRDIRTLQDKAISIELTLEHETNRNIRVVAEGHAILNRRLDEALKVESEREMLLIRVNRMENELRKVKEELKKLETA